MSLWLTFSSTSRSNVGTGPIERRLVDAYGTRHVWSFNLVKGMAGSFAVGIVSSLFGIGGGPVQVPLLIFALNYPAHVATATSHAILALTALGATVLHAYQGDYAHDATLTLWAAGGAMLGAPLGARLSVRVPGAILVRILGAMLAFIAFRLFTASAEPSAPAEK